jgi:hypothetical protein
LTASATPPGREEGRGNARKEEGDDGETRDREEERRVAP